MALHALTLFNNLNIFIEIDKNFIHTKLQFDPKRRSEKSIDSQ